MPDNPSGSVRLPQSDVLHYGIDILRVEPDCGFDECNARSSDGVECGHVADNLDAIF